MRILASLIAASVVGFASPAVASPDDDVRNLLSTWSEAYAARNHAALADLHTPLARIRGVDNVTYIGREAISEMYYFDAHKAKAQSVDLVRHECQILDDGNFEGYYTGLCSGTYVVRQTLSSGETRARPARFSMALVAPDKQWMIYDHHVTWLPAVVADCGTVLPPDKAALASGSAGQTSSDLCPDPVKTGSIGTPALVEPVGAAVIAPAR